MINREARQLNRILGSLTLVFAGDMLLPIIESLAHISKVANTADELEMAGIKGLGLEVVAGHIKAPTAELHSQVVKLVDDISNKEVNVKLPTLSLEQFTSMAKENAHLSASDLVLIRKFLVS